MVSYLERNSCKLIFEKRLFPPYVDVFFPQQKQLFIYIYNNSSSNTINSNQCFIFIKYEIKHWGSYWVVVGEKLTQMALKVLKVAIPVLKTET